MADVNSKEPITITTKNGHVAVLRPFVPPRLSNETRGVFLRYAKINPDVLKGKSESDETDFEFNDGIPAEIVGEINDLTLKRMVLKIDGVEGDGVLDYVLDNLEQDDYQEVVLKCNEISKATTLSDEKKDS